MANTSVKPRRDAVFISYAHGDQETVDWRSRVRAFLDPIARYAEITLWDDSLIQAGTDWRASIELGLRRARVAILLIGPRFLASEFILSEELPRLLAAAEEDGVIILPVITQYAPYKFSVMERYQAFNDPSKPLEDMRRAKQNAVLNKLAAKVAECFVGEL